MTRQEVDEYKAKALCDGAALIATKLVTDHLCHALPYPGCEQKAAELTDKAATEFFASSAQAVAADAIQDWSRS